MVHAQAAHMINIYELGTRAPSPSRSPSLDQPKESSPSPQDFQVGSFLLFSLPLSLFFFLFLLFFFFFRLSAGPSRLPPQIYYLLRPIRDAILYEIARPGLKN